MVKAKRRKHRTSKKYVGAKKALKLAREAYRIGAPYAKSGSKKAGELAKKHLTKENLQKAIAASKAATSKLKSLLKMKKNGSQRITMSIFRA